VKLLQQILDQMSSFSEQDMKAAILISPMITTVVPRDRTAAPTEETRGAAVSIKATKMNHHGNLTITPIDTQQQVTPMRQMPSPMGTN